jgi:hypothetical protein
MLPDDQIFAGDPVDANGNIIYDLYHNGDKVDHIEYKWYELYGKKYHYLSANSNEYCGTSRTIDPEPQGDAALALLNDGWLPAYNSANKTWIKVGGCADGYYSDWIVTFMPADSGDNPNPTTYSVRVMAEDLSATEASDFDFNDVVIDVYYTTGQTKATIILQAAGGTLPLRINEDDTKEVHSLFGVGTNVMVNTGWGGSNGANDVEPVSFTIDFALTDMDNDGKIDENDFLLCVKEIKLEVKKTLSTGTPGWFEMTADEGAPAAKFAVPIYRSDGTEVEWAAERESLKDKYGKFSEWATTASHIMWWDVDKAAEIEAEEEAAMQNQGN